MSFSLKICCALGIVAVLAFAGGTELTACPACADNVAAADSGTARGFAASILGLISLPILLVGGVVFSLVRAKGRSAGALAVIPVLIGGLLFTGCGGDTGGDEAAALRVPADMSKAVQVSGVVTFEGAAPEVEMIDVSADEYCGVQHEEGAIASNEVVINDGKLANVFVYVSKGLEDYSFDAPSTPVVLDQQGCRYHPHVLGVMIGQPLEIRNSDPTIHNVHAMTKNNKAFNLGQSKDASDQKTFENEEVMIPVVCDVHGWMKSWIGVLHHPAFAVSDENGAFSFQAPPGEYTVTAWHERFGTRTEAITVEEGKPFSLNFSFN